MAQNRMCPHCRAFVEPKLKICPYCDGEMGRRPTQAIDPGASTRPMASEAHQTTFIILTINFGLYLAMTVLSYKLGSENLMAIDSRVLDVFGAKVRYNIIIHGEWWRLMTAGFLHGGIFHILMNSWVLFDLGATVEQVYGTPRFLVIYLLSNVTGFYVSMQLSNVPSIGASAALCGLIGAMMAFAKRSNQSFIWSMYLRWILMIAIIGLFIGFIDNFAHLGGFIGGFAIGWVAAAPAREEAEGLWKAAASLACIVAAASLVMAYRGISVVLDILQP